MPKVSVNGIEVYYEVQGEGAPVMLIMGLSGVGAAWGEQIQRFAEDFRVIVPDHRGTGRTSKPEEGYTIEQHASDMAETLRAIGQSPAHVVGTSTGGAIAQVMALDYPDVVRSAVLSSTWAKTDAYYGRALEIRKRALEESGDRAYTEVSALYFWSARYIRENPAVVAQWVEDRVRNPADPAILAKRIDMLSRHDALHRLDEVRKPVLVISGEDDTCMPPYFSEELANGIPDAELAMLSGGHLLFNESPEAFHARVREFLIQH